MKLNLNAGNLAAALKTVPGKYAVLVAEGDSLQVTADHDAMTVTVYAAAEKAAAPAPKKAKAAAEPEPAQA